MSLVIKKSGIAMWRGNRIGTIRKDGDAWLFYSETAGDIIPAFESAYRRHELVNRLTRKIVAKERQPQKQ